EAPLRPVGRDDLRVRECALREVGAGGVTGDELHEQEGHHGHAEQQRRRDEHPPADVPHGAEEPPASGRPGPGRPDGRGGTHPTLRTRLLGPAGVALPRGDTVGHCRPTARRSTCHPAGEYSTLLRFADATTVPELYTSGMYGPSRSST